jgi:two-component system sensor histidine kinase DesK
VGQSLSAISLKGDLAIRLLPRDTQAARGEIVGMTSVARDAMREVRSAGRTTSPASLRAELDGAAALLAAAGIDARIDVVLGHLAAPVEEAFAWAVRVGVAELLQHSEARVCSITAKRRGGTVSLEMVTDQARPRVSEGQNLAGLTGLVERVRALSGGVSGGRTGEGGFRLFVQMPVKGGTP